MNTETRREVEHYLNKPNWCQYNKKTIDKIKKLFGEFSVKSLIKYDEYIQDLENKFEGIVNRFKKKDWAYIAYPDSSNSLSSAGSFKGFILYSYRESNSFRRFETIERLERVVEHFEGKTDEKI
jgi:hypothetical protein